MGCYVYEASSDVPGNHRATYHFNNKDTYGWLEPFMVGLPTDTSRFPHAVYNWYTKEVKMLTKNQTLEPGYEGHVYGVTTPVLADTWVFLGETNKYVTHATIRFNNVVASQKSLAVDVTGAKSETVQVCAAKVATMKVVCKQIIFDNPTKATTV